MVAQNAGSGSISSVVLVIAKAERSCRWLADHCANARRQWRNQRSPGANRAVQRCSVHPCRSRCTMTQHEIEAAAADVMGRFIGQEINEHIFAEIADAIEDAT